MPTSNSFTRLTTLTGALILMALPALAVDKAIVVGVNHYPGLTNAAGEHPDLAGCINDAQSMAKTLKTYGFQVKLLPDAKKADIVNAIKTSGQSDRFVFYFAGHGTRTSDRSSNILPNDAKEGGEQNDLPAEELNALVRAVQAKSRTVLLDSCFSGGMLRSFGSKSLNRNSLKSRFYVRKSALKVAAGGKDMRGPIDILIRGSKDLVEEPNSADDTSDFDGNENKKPAGTVCYFVATRANQTAAEDDFNGSRHGVFTYFLTRQLNGKRPTWGDVQAKVGGDVSDYMENEQNPTLTPTFTNKTLFDGGGSAPKPPQPDNLWDVFNGDHVDRSKLEISMFPNRTDIPLDTTLSFKTTIGSNGYLVLLEKGTSGNINLLFPRQLTTQAAKVKEGSIFRIPETGKIFRAKDAGSERMRAIIFSDAKMAQALLDVFKDDAGSKRSLDPKIFKTKTRDVSLEDDVMQPFYTSDLSFEVVD